MGTGNGRSPPPGRTLRSPEHPFGYGRERYIYAFIVSIVLFSVGGLFALYEAWGKLQHPHAIEGAFWWVPLAVLLGAIIAESFSFRTAIIESNHVRGKQGWVKFVRSAKQPELPVILLEDLGALVGLMFALFGVSLTLITGNGIWDALGTAMIGFLLVAIAAVLAVETKSLLLGESATKDGVVKIRAAIESDGTSIIHLKTLHLGPEELLVAAKISIGHSDTGQEIAQAIDDAESRIREAVPIARVIYLEPDVQRVSTPQPGPAVRATSVREGPPVRQPRCGYRTSGLLRSTSPLMTATPRPRTASTAPTRAGAT